MPHIHVLHHSVQQCHTLRPEPEDEWSNAETPETARPPETITPLPVPTNTPIPRLEHTVLPQPQGRIHPPARLLLRPARYHRSSPFRPDCRSPISTSTVPSSSAPSGAMVHE